MEVIRLGSTAAGDVPSGAFARHIMSHASAATDAASALINNIGANVFRAPQNIIIDSAWWEPTGADQDAQSTASYRIRSIMDGSTDGLGTRTLASSSASASTASNTTRVLTLIAAPTVAAGNVVHAQYGATVGGTHAGTVVRAGVFHFNYRPV